MPKTLLTAFFTLAVMSLFFTGCSGVVKWFGIRLLYDETPIAAERVLRDQVYREGSTLPKHRLDLFLPEGEGWPVLVFVHGGGWTEGDKALVVSGADVYGNIGRFYASNGFGVAVVNYRLQPAVTWREQVADVAHAVAWVHRNAARYGGDPEAIFLSGHSAGAQLVTYVALAPEPLAETGLSPELVCGVIAVSGAAYDIADPETYERGAKRPYYEKRFRAGDPGEDWMREASAMTYLTADAPPFLLLHGAREWKSLRYQNELLHRALQDAGVSSDLRIATQTHSSMVLAFSREDKLPGASALEFLRDTDC